MKINKRCSHCGEEFESEPHWNKLYCSVSCSNLAKVHRRVARDKPKPIVHDADIGRYLTILHYPTAIRLNREAELIADDEYIKVVGMNHYWDKPPNIAFVKQPLQENQTDVWIMTRRESSPLDALLRR